MALHDYKPWRYLLQVCNYSIFVFLIGYFSDSPSVEIRTENESFITIAFAHAGALLEPCRTLTSEELSELAQNMRATEDCPRARSPVKIQATLEQNLIYEARLNPPGLFDDGVVDVFYSGRVPAGQHELKIEMDDSVREIGINYSLHQEVSIDPGKILLITFEKDKGFVIN